MHITQTVVVINNKVKKLKPYSENCMDLIKLLILSRLNYSMLKTKTQ